MEYRELLARLAGFFNRWNRHHVPAGQVNRLQIKMHDQTINYVFNGQILCTIEVVADQELRNSLNINPLLAEKRLLLSILETTSNLAASPDLAKISDVREREEVVVLLLRLYHALETDIIKSFPDVRALFNRKYFRKHGRTSPERIKLMASIERFRDDLDTYFYRWTGAGPHVAAAEDYLAAMSIAELCVLLNAAIIITGEQSRWPNVTTAARIIMKLALPQKN